MKGERNVAVPIWKREPHPIAVIGSFIALLLIIGYTAYMFGMLPIQPKSEFEMRVTQLARDSQGDFKKLTPADQKYLNDHTTGRGAIALSAAYRMR